MLAGGGLGGGDQVEIVLDALDRRHEDAEPAVARLDRERGADGAAGFAELLLDALLLAAVVGGEVRHRLGAAPRIGCGGSAGAGARLRKSGSGPRGTVGSAMLV